jgi:hypothetical protein
VNAAVQPAPQGNLMLHQMKAIKRCPGPVKTCRDTPAISCGASPCPRIILRGDVHQRHLSLAQGPCRRAVVLIGTRDMGDAQRLTLAHQGQTRQPGAGIGQAVAHLVSRADGQPGA